ncbi:MAG: hypothetical protein ACYTF5_14450 [Planctomycetota bacterium]|jgi:hypothetical protein
MNGRAPSLLVVGLALAGCSIFDGGDDPIGSAHPVIIPLPGDDGESGPERNLSAYYRNVFAQLRTAYRARDLETLRHLLAQHQRSDLPDHISRLLGQFEVLAGGVQFELALPKSSRIRLVEPRRPLSEPQGFRLVVAADPTAPVVELGGGGSELPCSFLCTLKIREHGVFGERREYRTSKALPVSRPHRLSAGAPLHLDFAVPESTGEVVIREVHLTVELLTCQVRIDDRVTPIRRTMCCSQVSTAYPPNHGHIQRAPLKTLREALRRGSPKYFRHVLLAAHFMPANLSDQAMGLLVRKLRVGTNDQARVAMVGLSMLSGENLGVTDRQVWLHWWERHKAKGLRPGADKPGTGKPGADKPGADKR